jgi:Mg2+-importing ATPase
VRTGGQPEFGRIALGLGERHEETEFQAGLRHFSGLLAIIAGVLTASIFVINVLLSRALIDALLFSLAIAVGITPQLLPAVVTTSLATGSRRLAARKVLVKRLVCIEDLGDIEVLLTDKTGTLTEGRISFQQALDADGRPSDAVGSSRPEGAHRPRAARLRSRSGPVSGPAGSSSASRCRRSSSS